MFCAGLSGITSLALAAGLLAPGSQARNRAVIRCSFSRRSFPETFPHAKEKLTRPKGHLARTQAPADTRPRGD
jgi:hypothetical protein